MRSGLWLPVGLARGVTWPDLRYCRTECGTAAAAMCATTCTERLLPPARSLKSNQCSAHAERTKFAETWVETTDLLDHLLSFVLIRFIGAGDEAPSEKEISHVLVRLLQQGTSKQWMAVMVRSGSDARLSNCTRLWCSKYPHSTRKIFLEKLKWSISGNSQGAASFT